LRSSSGTAPADTVTPITGTDEPSEVVALAVGGIVCDRSIMC